MFYKHQIQEILLKGRKYRGNVMEQSIYRYFIKMQLFSDIFFGRTLLSGKRFDKISDISLFKCFPDASPFTTFSGDALPVLWPKSSPQHIVLHNT